MTLKSQKETLLVAFGGNALLRKNQQGTVEEQFDNLRVPIRQIARLSRQYRTIITHGNAPQIGKVLEKYLKGTAAVSCEDRARIMRLVENLTLGTAAVGYRTESMHGAGSPQAQRIMIARQGNLEQKKRLAKKIAGIAEEKK